MSTTYSIVCDKCKKSTCVGQGDRIYAYKYIADFLHDHTGHPLRFLNDHIDDERSENYESYEDTLSTEEHNARDELYGPPEPGTPKITKQPAVKKPSSKEEGVMNEPDRSGYLTIAKLIDQIAESGPGLMSIDITHDQCRQLKTDADFHRYNPGRKGAICVIEGVDIVKHDTPRDVQSRVNKAYQAVQDSPHRSGKTFRFEQIKDLHDTTIEQRQEIETLKEKLAARERKQS